MLRHLPRVALRSMAHARRLPGLDELRSAAGPSCGTPVPGVARRSMSCRTGSRNRCALRAPLTINDAEFGPLASYRVSFAVDSARAAFPAGAGSAPRGADSLASGAAPLGAMLPSLAGAQRPVHIRHGEPLRSKRHTSAVTRPTSSVRAAMVRRRGRTALQHIAARHKVATSEGPATQRHIK